MVVFDLVAYKMLPARTVLGLATKVTMPENSLKFFEARAPAKTAFGISNEPPTMKADELIEDFAILMSAMAPAAKRPCFREIDPLAFEQARVSISPVTVTCLCL